ncbi:MAG: hypothetical protein M5R42_05495 [Rhodocyclaceae bacterium]|nr:hypothetical protein [Rhodocyclaceae bacterium]
MAGVVSVSANSGTTRVPSPCCPSLQLETSAVARERPASYVPGLLSFSEASRPCSRP